jgi:hypothetical protein
MQQRHLLITLFFCLFTQVIKTHMHQYDAKVSYEILVNL